MPNSDERAFALGFLCGSGVVIILIALLIWGMT